MDLKSYVKALRPEQWYKNLLVFLAIIYSSGLFDTGKFVLTLVGFASLSLLSSANYVFNDLMDRNSDSRNPLKKSRPIASGKISPETSFILFAVLLATGFIVSFLLNRGFFLLMAIFVAISAAYNVFLKKEIFLDILVIAVNFVIRAVSGALIIKVYISPWLILCPFFLSIFISTGKRKAEISILGKSAADHRSTLLHYTEKITDPLMTIATTTLVISYTLYALTVDAKLLLTLPMVLYGILRYLYFIYTKPLIAANPELVFRDGRLMLSLVLWLVLTFFVIYSNL